MYSPYFSFNFGSFDGGIAKGLNNDSFVYLADMFALLTIEGEFQFAIGVSNLVVRELSVVRLH